MLNFCTLFDINFISQGLSMYESLKEHCKNDFTLYIFAFCDESYNLLKELNFKNVKVISLSELEEGIPALLTAKNNRTKGEYCWTCGSASIKYCIEQFNLDQCTYLDADIYFYSDPKVLLDEMEDKSVLITEHRYTPKYDQTNTSGKYCVQFVSFKNDEKGMRVLNWWVDRCIEWCYAKCEDGKFGDQKYLDDWAERFEGVHVLEHLGGGVAPWNVQQYNFDTNNDEIYLNCNGKNCNIPLIFYHYHDIKILKNGLFADANYEYYTKNEFVKDFLYKPYTEKLAFLSKNLNKINPNIKIIKNKYESDLPLKRLSNLRKSIIKIKFGKNAKLEIFGKQII